jgi:large conductance mechanosensitive channel
MLKGFRDFIMRGNVIDLAVAVVIGGAFAKVVDTVVTSLINPLVTVILGGKSSLAGSVCLGNKVNGACPANLTLNYAAIITALIVFAITAAVIYFAVVVPMIKVRTVMDRRKAQVEEEVAAEVTAEVALLTEIRDELRARGSV